MRSKLLAIIAGIPMIVSTTWAYAPTKDIPVSEVKEIQKIQSLIEGDTIGPTKDEIAAKLIEKHRQQLLKQRVLLEKKKKAEAKKKRLEEARKFKQLAMQAVSQTSKATFSIEKWRPLVTKYPWPVEQAMLVMAKESGGNPRAVSATDDHGLFQIHGGYAMYGEKIYDPAFNVALAYNNYYKTRGWTPWYAVQGILW